MYRQRRCGVLLHPSSLPGPEGVGTFGSDALRFVDFLFASGQSLWQVLPLGPTGYGNSPYSAYSAFAGNPLLLDLAVIAAEGDLDPARLPAAAAGDRVDFDLVYAQKVPLLEQAAVSFLASEPDERKREFWQFCDNTFWLHDYALFRAAKNHFAGKEWHSWPAELARRDVAAVDRYSRKLGSAIGVEKYLQWQFYRQWNSLKRYANDRGISIIGDAPIFVAHDSVDVWCNQHLFKLNAKGRPLVVAGVPPDYFSTTGQRWGNPLYDWEKSAADGYGWWLSRIRNDLKLYDVVRIDHFRGFEAHWEIPCSHRTAAHGRWVKGPGENFFAVVQQALGSLPLIAEDLGLITPEVEQLRDAFSLPGMKILQFAYGGGASNPYLPHNYDPNCVVYTGTHDNDTTTGWYANLDPGEKQRVRDYLRCRDADVCAAMVRAALASVARYAVLPVQDLLGLGSESRMNRPGVASGNWGWRLRGGELTEHLAEGLREEVGLYNRLHH